MNDIKDIVRRFRSHYGTPDSVWRWHVARSLDEITEILNEIANEEK